MEARIELLRIHQDFCIPRLKLRVFCESMIDDLVVRINVRKCPVPASVEVTRDRATPAFSSQ
jgi:hypothetical protein